MENFQLTREEATVAAEWWASKIDGRHHHDNGDRSSTGVMSMFLADMCMEAPTKEQIEQFKESLISHLLDDENWSLLGFGGLHCDYGPGLFLRDAAEEAGIEELNFPFKTSMYFQDGEILVRDGYMAPPKKIYPAD